MKPDRIDVVSKELASKCANWLCADNIIKPSQIGESSRSIESTIADYLNQLKEKGKLRTE